MWPEGGCSPQRAHVGSVREGQHAVGGTLHGAGEERDDEGAVERKHCRLTAAPVPLHCLGEEVEEGGWEEGVFSLLLVLTALRFLTGNKLIFPKPRLFCP